MRTSISSAYSLNSQWSITDDIALKSNMNICGALRDLVQFVQSKKREKHPCRSDNLGKVACKPLSKPP